MKEIGGYFELEKAIGNEFYDFLRFNTSRNALQFVIRSRNIKKIYLPYYLCLVIEKTIQDERVDIEYYHIDSNFFPIINNYDNESYVYVVNYFGLLSEKSIISLNHIYDGHIILDNTHSFFMKPFCSFDIIYNCRKYFGIPDGAYLYTDLNINDEYPLASSIDRIHHIFGRYESDASSFYEDYLKSEESLENQDIYLMSKITRNMLLNIDYEGIMNQRRKNYMYLDKNLSSINKLKIDMSSNHDFMYPLLIDNGKELRKKLISKKIYVPLLWPGLDKYDLNSFELNIFNDLVLIPIDQRYNTDDMEYIVGVLKECIYEEN